MKVILIKWHKFWLGYHYKRLCEFEYGCGNQLSNHISYRRSRSEAACKHHAEYLHKHDKDYP
jgi:hypothetical protein